MPDHSGALASAARRWPSSAGSTGWVRLAYRDAATLPWLDTDNLADRTRTFFDAQANPTTTNFAYNARGFRTSTTDALSHTTQFAYDKAGNQTAVTDPLNHTTQYVYNPDNRLTKTTDVLLRNTLYGYDAAGRRTTVTDPDNNTTTTAYDKDNRVTQVTDPLNHSTSYGYDDAGNLTTTTDRDNRTRTFGYDNVNRRTSENWLDSAGTVLYAITDVYDAAGRLTAATDPDSTYTYGYDTADRLTSVDNAGTPNAPHVVLGYGYDNANNKTSVTDNFGGAAGYTFDAANRLTQATALSGGVLGAQAGFGYDNGNRLTSTTDSAGGPATVNRAYTYDNADRLTQLTDSSSVTGALASYSYGYDNANRVTNYTGPDGNLNYSYDITNQLMTVTGAHPENYNYDANGNRNTNGNVPGADNRQQSDGTYNYAYDNEGNVTTQTRLSDGQYTTFSWDYRNRLTEAVVKNAAGQTLHDDRFVYDVNDRRIGKSVDGVWTWTAYDGPNAFADFNGAGALAEHYLYGLAADALLARVDSSNNAEFYLTDLNGSVRQLVTAGGVVVDQLTFDSFGNILMESSVANGDRFKYTSREYDAELGLYYYRDREYAPTEGKFLSEDPSGLGPDVNDYRYVGNNPANATDLTGCFADPPAQDDPAKLKAKVAEIAAKLRPAEEEYSRLFRYCRALEKRIEEDKQNYAQRKANGERTATLGNLIEENEAALKAAKAELGTCFVESLSRVAATKDV